MDTLASFSRTTSLKAYSARFTDAERDALARRLRSFRLEQILDPSASTFSRALRVAADLPSRVIRKLSGLRYGDENDLGAVLLSNTPLDACIPSQPRPTREWHEKRTCISEAMHLVMLAAIGCVPVSYAAENSGDTVATLSPRKGDEIKQESTSSTSLLELHTEDTAHLYAPDIVSLSVLQEDATVPVGTLVASMRRAMSRLTARQVAVGRNADFSIATPSSFKSAAALVPRKVPMFYGSDQDLLLNFDAHAMRSSNPEGQLLIEEMKRILQEVAVMVTLRRGDMLVLDNRSAAHGRVGFRANFERPRITQRAFGRFDFASSRPLRRGNSTIHQ